MGNKDEWGPWTDHDLSGCPVTNGFIVQIEIKDTRDVVTVGIAYLGRDYSAELWDKLDKACVDILQKTGRRLGILRYRIKKPKGMEELLEMRAEKKDLVGV